MYFQNYYFWHFRVRSITIYLGITSLSDTTNRVTGQAVRMILHPSYSPSTLANDLALIQLASPVTLSSRTIKIQKKNYKQIFSGNLQPIPLSNDVLLDYTSVVISGWGRTSDSKQSFQQNSFTIIFFQPLLLSAIFWTLFL